MRAVREELGLGRGFLTLRCSASGRRGAPRCCSQLIKRYLGLPGCFLRNRPSRTRSAPSLAFCNFTKWPELSSLEGNSWTRQTESLSGFLSGVLHGRARARGVGVGLRSRSAAARGVRGGGAWQPLLAPSLRNHPRDGRRGAGSRGPLSGTCSAAPPAPSTLIRRGCRGVSPEAQEVFIRSLTRVFG